MKEIDKETLETFTDIRTVFDMVKKAGRIEQIIRKSFTILALADLFATLEKHRVPVGMIFMSSGDAEELEGCLDQFYRHQTFPGKEGIDFIGAAWGADFYATSEVSRGEIIAVVYLRVLQEVSAAGYGVAKLTCTDIVSASKASLDLLPQYLTSEFPSVRRAAQDRYTELMKGQGGE